MKKTLKELADYVGGEVVGDENIKIKGVMTIDEATEGYITFVSNKKYIKKLGSPHGCLLRNIHGSQIGLHNSHQTRSNANETVV